MTQQCNETDVLGQIAKYLETAWQNTTHELVYECIAYAKGIVETARFMTITDSKLMTFLSLNIETAIDNAEMYGQDNALVPLCDAWMLLNPEADYEDVTANPDSWGNDDFSAYVVVQIPIVGVATDGYGDANGIFHMDAEGKAALAQFLADTWDDGICFDCGATQESDCTCGYADENDLVVSS